MDWSLFIFIAVVLYFGYRGYKNGLLKSVSRILSILAGYLCAIFYTAQVSEIIEANFQLQGVVAIISASLLLFIGAGLVVSVLFWLLQKLVFDEGVIGTASSVGGAAVGTMVGLLLAIVIVWSFVFVRDIRDIESYDAATAPTPSRIESLASKVASKAVGAAMSVGSANAEVANLSAALVQSPAAIAQQTQRLMSSDDLQNLLDDPDNQAVLSSGDIEAVQQLPAFQQLLKNPDMQALAASAGMLDNVTGGSQTVATALATQFTDIWVRTQRVKNDQRLQEIISDPEFQQKIQSGNPVDLLTNARLLELANIIFDKGAGPDEAGVQTPGNTPTGSATPTKPEAEKKLYRWKDKDGRVYYSDVKPES